MLRKALRLGSPAPAAILIVILAVIAGCSSPSGPTPTPDPDPGPADEWVLAGAGDIAFCGSPGPEATARLLDGIPGTVFTAGDNAYPMGRAIEFAECYLPTWGRHVDRTFATIGNHDWETQQGTPFYDYFGEHAGPKGLGYYTFRLGPWRIIALNSEIVDPAHNSPSQAAAQTSWLRNELTTNVVPCTLAIWHRPLYSSGQNGPQADMRDTYKLLYDFNADVVINGHDHNYERFGPQDADGRSDTARGIREFIVGTGGVEPYVFFNRRPNSEFFQTNTWGVLKLTLKSGAYAWDYIPVPGRGNHDIGSGTCH